MPRTKIGTNQDDIFSGGYTSYSVIDGLDGNDTVNYIWGLGYYYDPVTADLALGIDFLGIRLVSIENLTGAHGADILKGNNKANILFGGQGDDILEGRSGNDFIRGGTGADTMSGGAGIDTVSYGWANPSWYGIMINLTTQTVSGANRWVDGDTISGFENAIGSDLGDTLIGDSGANRLNAGPRHPIWYTRGDSLYGLDGDDLLILLGDSNPDILDGGTGFDTVSYAGTESGISVEINLRSGRMRGGAEGDTLISIEALIGTDGNDSLIMDDADNRIMGGGGDDFIDGGNGNDILIGGAGADFLHGGYGRDTASYIGSDAAVQISLTDGTSTGGHAEGDTHSWIHNINGSQFDDVITGDILNNRLRGMDGNDTLTGRAGRDTLFGGEGDDVFAFVDLADHVATSQSDTSTLSIYASSTRDRIRDFTSGEDMLQFAASDFGGSVVNTDQISALGLTTATDTAFAYTGSELYYVTYASAADFATDQVTVYHLAHLSGDVSLTDSDFSFI